MWRTNIGERTLEGVEARLFADCLWDLLEDHNLSESNDYELGIRVFDGLSYPQKIGVLHEVGLALLKPEVPCPPLTAVLEGGVAAVFRHLRISVEIEIDEPPDYRPTWRQRIARTCRECEVPDIPRASSADEDAWDDCIQALNDRILWDEDYEDGEYLMDGPPERNAELRKSLRITDDYFAAIAPDPKDKDVPRLVNELVALCRGICQPSRKPRKKRT
jgi:hypothetical protein